MSTPAARVALATFAELPDHWGAGEREVARLLGERGIDTALVPWDGEGIDWGAYELVVVRNTWNYTRHRERFLDWADRVGPRLRNSPALIGWNSDKVYLADLEAAGIPVAPTTFVRPGDPIPELEGEVAVKPNVSAGGRDTGRFSPAAHEEAVALVEAITASGRTAMVQPYQSSVDTHGETAIVHLRGRPSHVLRKRAVLRPDEVAPVSDDAVGAATVMYGSDLVGPGEADEAERELAATILAWIADRFGEEPFIARVDMVRGADGAPLLLELEAVEPNLYLELEQGLAERVADAIAVELDVTD